ncbi:response regulator transcription factor [Clostridium intestinale]|uniref:Stage 0 sporulation protein A homolog n=1 Tax=Clostridium intestinale TaxID=36845 RepID=A0A7D6ZNQ7_9CLOT|nr:response regulator transcription factor [Clostridium intestinale]QLY78843.1 response regulator transcription factor [Clostridium intestinale]
MNNILIIEDEEKVGEVIKAYLEKEGYKVYHETRGLMGLELFKKIDFKLVILDLMLPDISGEEVCEKIRSFSDNKSEVYLYMLTAKGSLENKIEGLNMGADEYLVKPFSPRELTARVNALFRRIGALDKADILSFNDGKLIINYDERRVLINGKGVSVTPNEFDILYVLAKNNGKVLTREQLIDKVFGLDFDGYDRTIDVHIKNLRKKIEEDSKNPKYIITVMKVGYKFGGDS